MEKRLPNVKTVQKMLKQGKKLPFAMQYYPSRGQTTVQELYETKTGKLFLKRNSERNHQECQVKIKDGTLAQRELWAYNLAAFLKLRVPELILMDPMTTVQIWLDIPDGRQYTTSQRPMDLEYQNVFECALFDWVTGQIDRHDANYLYDYNTREIVLIDSGFAFLKYAGSLPDYLRIFEAAYTDELDRNISTAVKNDIVPLIQGSLDTVIPFKNGEERSALIRRAKQLDDVFSVRGVINLFRSPIR